MTTIEPPSAGDPIVDRPPPTTVEIAGETRAKKEVPTTLTGYLASRTSAPTFLKALREKDVWGFAAEDVEEALQAGRDADPRFTKTASLLSQALRAKDTRHVRPVSDYARAAVLDRLSDYPHWLGNDWHALEVDDRAGRIADAVGRRFSDPKRGREAHNLFSATLLLLAQDGLSAETAYRATARALDARPETTPRAERDRVTLLAGPRAKPSELRGLVQSVLPWIARSDAAEQALERAERRATSERDHRLELEATVADRDRRIAELTSEVTSLGERIKGLEEDLRSHAVHGSHDLDQIRSGARAFLDSRLRDLLDTAHEALDLDPPRPHIAKEKLEIAQEAIEEQVRWLTR